MGTKEAFLAEIVENPDDDVPRLVFADWLDDHGESDRAEFIRTQCRLARLGEGDPERADLERRESELLGAFGLDWAEPLRGLVSEFAFRRGFVEAVEVTDREDLAGCLRRAMDLAPVRSLRLVLSAEEVPEVPGAGPGLGRLRELFLALDSEPDPHGLRSLFESGRFAGLTTFMLDCDDLEVSAEDVSELLAPGVLPRLRRLGLAPDYPMVEEDEAVLRELIGADHLASLRALHLPFFSLEVQAHGLGRCPAFSGLEELDLRRSFASEQRWRELLWAPALDRLRRLDLTDARLPLAGDTVLLRDTALAAEIEQRFDEVSFATESEWSPYLLPTWAGLSW